MRYYSKMPVGILEVTKEAYEASLMESIGLGEDSEEYSKFKNCPGLLSLSSTHYGNKQATVKDKDGILKKITYFSSEGVSLLKEIIAWSGSSMLSRMNEKITELEASLAYTRDLLVEARIENEKYNNQINTLQYENEVKDFLLTVSSRKNWKNKSICRDEYNCLCLDSCINTGSCEGCDRSFIGKVADYL